MTTISQEPLDLYKHSHNFQRELALLHKDERILPENRRAIARFLLDAQSGRLVRQKAKKRISLGRCRKMLYTLKRFALCIQVPFEAVTLEVMEQFIVGLESGTIGKITPVGARGKYTHDTVLDFKKILKRFYGWLFGTDLERVRLLTGWFDTAEVLPELHTFGLAEVQKMALAGGSLQERALLWLLFDGGFRIGELLNVRLHDVTFRPDADGIDTCFIRIRVSKTKPRTVSLPLATQTVRLWVERHPAGGTVRQDGIIQAKDPNGLLITWRYNYCKKVLAELGNRELGERLYPHRLRHCSATFYAKHLNHYQLTARFGWTMGSRALQRYIDHAGVLAEDTASIIRRGQ